MLAAACVWDVATILSLTITKFVLLVAFRLGMQCSNARPLPAERSFLVAL